MVGLVSRCLDHSEVRPCNAFTYRRGCLTPSVGYINRYFTERRGFQRVNHTVRIPAGNYYDGGQLVRHCYCILHP
jgi:hypothetical protein